ncbi:MAG: Type 1 glutamine amidotransferase-like domain-containing protein, partial [Candidatus Marinimicrobia bacterium]|nr:Type 1 glutamine amidotransferase-like domain-containing protein [Candidatus Neomarinimicrobiota bacterium]
LRLIPFQLNPHYIDAKPEGHAGESRADRLNEFITVNRDVSVVGLFEGSILRFEGHEITIIGDRPVKIFKYGQEVREVLQMQLKTNDQQIDRLAYELSG